LSFHLSIYKGNISDTALLNLIYFFFFIVFFGGGIKVALLMQEKKFNYLTGLVIYLF